MSASEVNIALARAKGGVACWTGKRSATELNHPCQVVNVTVNEKSGSLIIYARETAAKERGVDIQLQIRPDALAAMMEAVFAKLRTAGTL